jgi:metal-responsive CopG/Arc/MetJ family transcriptional regulator
MRTIKMPTDRQRVMVNLPGDLLGRVEAIAKKENRTLANAVCTLVMEALDARDASSHP